MYNTKSRQATLKHDIHHLMLQRREQARLQTRWYDAAQSCCCRHHLHCNLAIESWVSLKDRMATIPNGPELGTPAQERDIQSTLSSIHASDAFHRKQMCVLTLGGWGALATHMRSVGVELAV
eukprot:364406-Chlamydomonas_euryale.AAC.10